MKSVARIALAQINPTVGALCANSEKICTFIAQAKEEHADIVLFPELAICGYPPEDLLLKKQFIRDNLKALRALKKEAAGIIAIVGCVDIDTGGNLYNAAAVMANRKIVKTYHKIHLPNYGVFDERRYFIAGKRNVVFDIGTIRFGVSICEDMWEDETVVYAQARAGAHVLFNISASPFHAGKRKERARLLRKHARTTRTHVCYVNLVGGQDMLVFDGGSIVLSPQGKIIASGKPFPRVI